MAGEWQGGGRPSRGVRPEHRRQQVDGTAAATGASQHHVQMPGVQHPSHTAVGEVGAPRRLP